jgi:hypothetical protein
VVKTTTTTNVRPGGCLVPMLLACLTVSGCGGVLPLSHKEATTERTCVPLRPLSYNVADRSDDQGLDEYSGRPLSDQAMEVAKVIDVLPILIQLSALKQAGDTHSIRFLELRQMLTDRLLLTLFEVSSAIAEIVCERDRADQSADQMEAIDAARVKRLTLLSLVVGGVATIVSGGIGLAGSATAASDATAVAGGAFATLFGGSALFVTSQQEFHHERNLLKEVWDNPKQSSMFSPAVWRFLQRRHTDQSLDSYSEVVRAWRQQGRLGEPGSPGEKERMALIFGLGGAYTAMDLRARASMLETLEAHIHLMSEELELFLREMIQILIPQERLAS